MLLLPCARHSWRALFPRNSADGSADIVRASVDENGVASFGCKSDNDYAGLVLNRKDKTFNFMQSYRFSAALSGTYEEDDDYLIPTAKNSGSQSKFTFKNTKTVSNFSPKSPIPCGEFCYSADSEKTDKCLKNKALFAPESIRTDVITYIGKNEHDGQKDYVEIVLSPADSSYSMYRSGMVTARPALTKKRTTALFSATTTAGINIILKSAAMKLP